MYFSVKCISNKGDRKSWNVNFLKTQLEPQMFAHPYLHLYYVGGSWESWTTSHNRHIYLFKKYFHTSSYKPTEKSPLTGVQPPSIPACRVTIEIDGVPTLLKCLIQMLLFSARLFFHSRCYNNLESAHGQLSRT